MDDPKLYVTHNRFPRYVAGHLLKEFYYQLSWDGNERALDVGCGPGDITTEILLPLLPKDASLVGIDVSSNMIEYSIEHFSSERVSFKAVDFGTKEIHKHFPEEHFSKIFSFFCLHWIEDQQQMVTNLFTLLRPGGEFLSVMVPDTEMYVAFRNLSEIDQFKEYCKNVHEGVPPKQYSCEDLRNLFTRQGFDVITCEHRKIPSKFPNLEYITKSFESINLFVKRMPESVKKEYLTAFQEFLLQPTANPRFLPSGEIQMQNKLLVVFARRPNL